MAPRVQLMNPPPKNNYPLLCNQNPWSDNANTIWLGSTLRLHRNLEKFKFPTKLSTDKRQQILSLVSRELLLNEQLDQPTMIRAENMPPIEKEFLVEHFLVAESFHQAYTGEAFILDHTSRFLGLINLNDHLILQMIDTREELEKTWDHLVKIEMKLNQTMNFAFSPKFGFLTSDPMQCGTGLIGHIFLHVPLLYYTDRLEDILKKAKEEGIERSGLQGNPDEMIGDIVVFHNNYTLGLTEESVLSSLRTLATRLVIEEKTARQHLLREKESEMAFIKDKISRAYAILLHSYQLDAIETFEAIGLLKLGIDLGWVQGSTQASLNLLLFASRRAHLFCHYKQNFSQEELPHRRAEFIHEALKGLQLLI